MVCGVVLSLGRDIAPEPKVESLKPRLDKLAKGFGGRLGYQVRMLEETGTIGYRDKERFPSASTIKTVVMIEAFRQMERGELSWTEKLDVPPVGQRNASMWIAHLLEGSKVNIDGLIQLMMNVSDNTATVMLANRVGVENIESTMLAWGLKDTVCTINVPAGNDRLVRLRKSFANMGVTSPDEMGLILEKLYRKTAAGEAACEKMMRIMSHQYWDDFIEWQVPPGVQVCSKVGALNRSRSDAAIVFGPRPYVLTVYTDNQRDQSWTDTNEGHVAIRKISEMVWNGLNPGRAYQPASGAGQWYPSGAGVEDS